MEDLGTPQIFFLSSDKTRLTTKKFTVVLRLSLSSLSCSFSIFCRCRFKAGYNGRRHAMRTITTTSTRTISGETDESPSTDQKGAVPFPGRTSRTSAGFPRPVRSQLRHTVVRGRISLCRKSGPYHFVMHPPPHRASSYQSRYGPLNRRSGSDRH